MVIGGYLLLAILLITIGGYLLLVIILMTIDGYYFIDYFINGY
jgi:hypothetical protein